jgi:hypothetical protein
MIGEPPTRCPRQEPSTLPPSCDGTFNPEIDGGVRGSYSYVVQGMHLYAIRNINEPDGRGDDQVDLACDRNPWYAGELPHQVCSAARRIL